MFVFASKRIVFKVAGSIMLMFVLFLISSACTGEDTIRIDLSKKWKFSADTENIGDSQEWYSVDYDDSGWKIIDAGIRWEEQGYKELDEIGWYRKRVNIPKRMKGKNIWIKFGGVNDEYELFINGKSVSHFGEAGISVASRPTFTKLNEVIIYGDTNTICLKVNDWGNSGGIWRLPAVITTDESEVNNIFQPIDSTIYTAEKLGYKLFWEDQFSGKKLDNDKWAVRGIGPRAAGYVSPDAVRIKDGYLELAAYLENDSIKIGAVGTQNKFMTRYGYFECRCRLQKSYGNWAAFWIQSPKISEGEDPAEFGTEIDIMEYFKKSGEEMISHNLHWAYGPNQKSIGGLLSHVEGVSEGFHTFALEWTPEKYSFYVDGYKYYETATALSHIEEYIVLSMELPHSKESLKEAVFPDVFVIDYVKVYKKE